MSDQPTEDRWFGLGLANLVVLGLAVLVIVAGYVLLDRGSVTAAPVLLVVGYVVLVPVALLLGYRGLGSSGDDEEAASGGAASGGEETRPVREGGSGREAET